MFWLIGLFRGLIGWRGVFCPPPVFSPWSQGRAAAAEGLRAACCQVWRKSALSLEERCWVAGPWEGLVPFFSLINGSHENEGLLGEKKNHLGKSLALSEATAL